MSILHYSSTTCSMHTAGIIVGAAFCCKPALAIVSQARRNAVKLRLVTIPGHVGICGISIITLEF